MQTEDDIRELLKGEFDLEIPNFEKWNPPILNRQTKKPVENQRRDWVGISVDFWLDPRLHDTGPALQLFWIKLVCLRGASGDRLKSVDVAFLQRRIGVQAASAHRCISKLLKLGLIDVAKTRQTRQTRQTEEEEAEKPSSSSDEVLKLLPENGVRFYREKLGDRFVGEMQKCFLYWQSQPPSRKPFPIVFNRWVDRLERGDPDTPQIDWKKVFE